jgi:hypothetical protein
MESLDLRTSNQYVLVSVIPSCVCAYPRRISCQGAAQGIWHILFEGVVRYLHGQEGKFFVRVVNITWTDLDSLAFILHFNVENIIIGGYKWLEPWYFSVTCHRNYHCNGKC